MSSVSGTWPQAGPIKGVIFDIHSTLIDQGSPDEWLDAALAVAPHAFTPDERALLVGFLDTIWEGARISDPQSTRDLSFENHSRVFHELIDDGPSIDRSLAAALYEVMLDTWHAYEDTRATLESLRSHGVRICLLSNAGVRIASVLEREGVTPLVDAMVLSFEVGFVKPDPRIFRAALNALDLPAESVLMVGDNANDDGGGAALGIRTLILPRTLGRVHGLNAVTSLVRGVNAGQ